MNPYTPPCSFSLHGTPGAHTSANIAQHRSPPYGALLETRQVYTTSPAGPPWQNTVGYRDFIHLNARTGDYASYPWSVFHPLFVSAGLGYWSGGPPGPWTRLDQRPYGVGCHHK